MAYQPVDRGLPPEYLKEMNKAIVWLAEQGMSPEDIRLAGWGIADETTRQVRILKRLGPLKWHKTINVKGLPVEHWFTKGRWYSTWMFLRERPRSMKREVAVNSLYSLAEIEQIIANNSLTSKADRGRIKVANFGDVQNLNRLELKART